MEQDPDPWESSSITFSYVSVAEKKTKFLTGIMMGFHGRTFHGWKPPHSSLPISYFNVSSAENKALSPWPVVISNSLDSAICFVLEVKYSCCSWGLKDSIMLLCSAYISFLTRMYRERKFRMCIHTRMCSWSEDDFNIKTKSNISFVTQFSLEEHFYLNRITLLAKDVFLLLLKSHFYCEQY